MLKVYTAEYTHWWGANNCDEKHATVVAGSESEALGLVLMDFIDTEAEDWIIEDVDTLTEGVY